MSDAKTTWNDLAALGWPIYVVYKKANEARGGTMHGLGDIFLNTGIAAEYQCVLIPSSQPLRTQLLSPVGGRLTRLSATRS